MTGSNSSYSHGCIKKIAHPAVIRIFVVSVTDEFSKRIFS